MWWTGGRKPDLDLIWRSYCRRFSLGRPEDQKAESVRAGETLPGHKEGCLTLIPGRGRASTTQIGELRVPARN